MSAYPWTAWLWWSGGAMLGLLGLWLLYWSLIKDRAKGRRRCPKCWYNMSATEGLRCSECGHEAKREKKLLKTRRHKRWACVALLLGLLSFSSALTPKIQRDGWVKSTPTTAIIIAFPWLEERDVRGSWQAQLLHELKFRLANTTFDNKTKKYNYEQLIPDWQWNLLIKRIANMDERIPSADSQKLRPGSFTFPNRYEIIKLAINLGLLQYLEPVGEYSPHDLANPRLRVELPNSWYLNAPVPCQTWDHFIMDERDNLFKLTIKMSGFEEPLFHERVRIQPHGLYLVSSADEMDGFDSYWLFNLPETAKPGLAVLTFDIVYGVRVKDKQGHIYNFLPVCDATNVQQVQLVGSFEETVSRDDDPELDKLIHESFDVQCSEKLPAWADDQLVVFGLTSGKKEILDRIGKVARIRMWRENKLVADYRAHLGLVYNRHKIQVGGALDLGVIIPTVLEQVKTEETWRLQFEIDPVLSERYLGSKSYWPGKIEKEFIVKPLVND